MPPPSSQTSWATNTLRRVLRRSQTPERDTRPTPEAMEHAATRWTAAGANHATAGDTLCPWRDAVPPSLGELPVRVVQAADTLNDENSPTPDYELVRRLGVGGMGEVWQAYQPSLGRSVALKLAKRSGDPLADARLAAEAKITGELRHPGIVAIHELARTQDGRLFYVMPENVGSLWRNALDRRTRSENLAIFLKVAQAVAYAHTRGLVHRDIKPDNVLLGEHGEVWLGDWGVAASVAGDGKAPGLSPQTAFGGTPCYMAPEQAMGDWQRIGFATDVYLLGAVLVEVLTGKPPRTGTNALDCLSRAAYNAHPHPAFPSPLLSVALQALAPRPEDRFPGVEAFVHALRGVRTARIKSWLYRFAAVAVVLVFVLAALLPMLYGQDGPDASATRTIVSVWKDWLGFGAKPRPKAVEVSAAEDYARILAGNSSTISIVFGGGGDETPAGTSFTAVGPDARAKLLALEAKGELRRERYLSMLKQKNPQDAIQLYLLSQPWRNKLAYVLEPERVFSQMKERYADIPPPGVLYTEMTQLPPESVNVATLVRVTMYYDKSGDHGKQTATFRLVKQDGLFFVDWEHLRRQDEGGEPMY